MSKNENLQFELKTLLETHTKPFVIINEEYAIVAANQAYCDAFGIQEDQVVGAKCHQVLNQYDTPCKYHNTACPMDKVMSSGKSCETQQIRHDYYNQSGHIRITGHAITDSQGNRYLGAEINQAAKAAELSQQDQQLIGRSDTFLDYIEKAVRAAESDANLLITGESGTGKDRTAQFIHSRSHRKQGAYITLNCANTNEAFMGSELFGHEQLALPACNGQLSGLINDADGGTLYLDEIGDLPLDMQGRLLHFIETGQYSRVGSSDVLESDVRIIASSNHNLEAMIEDKTFRQDLYYRLSSISFIVPPLRERHEDIPLLTEYLLDKLGKLNNMEYTLDKDARKRLFAYDFRGNIRELENILLLASNLCTNGNIHVKHINISDPVVSSKEEVPGDLLEGADPSITLLEAAHINQLLEKHGGHRRKVASLLGISERTLYRKLVKYNLTTVGKPKKSMNSG